MAKIKDWIMAQLYLYDITGGRKKAWDGILILITAVLCVFFVDGNLRLAFVYNKGSIFSAHMLEVFINDLFLILPVALLFVLPLFMKQKFAMIISGAVILVYPIFMANDIAEDYLSMVGTQIQVLFFSGIPVMLVLVGDLAIVEFRHLRYALNASNFEKELYVDSEISSFKWSRFTQSFVPTYSLNFNIDSGAARRNFIKIARLAIETFINIAYITTIGSVLITIRSVFVLSRALSRVDEIPYIEKEYTIFRSMRRETITGIVIFIIMAVAFTTINVTNPIVEGRYLSGPLELNEKSQNEVVSYLANSDHEDLVLYIGDDTAHIDGDLTKIDMPSGTYTFDRKTKEVTLKLSLMDSDQPYTIKGEYKPSIPLLRSEMIVLTIEGEETYEMVFRKIDSI